MLQVSGPVIVEIGLSGRFRSCPIEPGDFCVAPAGASVPAARWRGMRQIVLTEFSPSLLRSVADALGLHSYELHAAQAIRDPRISHLLFALREEVLGGNSSGRAYVDSIAWALGTRLLSGHSAATFPKPHRGGLSRPLLKRVMEFVEEHLDEDLGLARLAAISRLSEDHFARAFRESAGVPPHRYLLQRRLARARQLLETSDTPIVDIAQALGFTDQSHLTNMFRRHLGLTPGQVRAESSRLPLVPELSNNTGILQ
ncbi:AraC family transcriptional regulator [uncultured Paludibaculum sp.]|uniref:AraC family transcriptional regulator n=1 Tax=uncultured Paludibaculum sp. TaxID=1765020 RepID=UPI002AAA8DCB|nr:AraC family transcriptional regulator [uncultured Paludibaculum sp.]